MKRHSALITALVMSLSLQATAAPKYIPVASGLFSTGQWYFEGEKSALGGNAALSFIPALQFSNRFSLIPTIESTYRGTRSAEELAGGNTLFQDTWDNGVNVKAVHGLGDKWTLREKAGYRFKWFRETTDESWNHGLYDYRIYSAGTEIERRWGKTTSLAVGYDFSLVQFPNYVSLESQQSSDRAREFAGANVLDNQVHLYSMRARMPLFWRMQTTTQIYFSPRDYSDQHTVTSSGLLTPELRHDGYTGTTFSVDRIFNTFKKSKLVTTLMYGYTGLNSNQNHYDARLVTFVSDHYDYDQNTLGTQMTLAFGKLSGGPMLIEAGYSYSHRNYRSRVIQAEDGTYESEKLFITEQDINLGFSYPLSKNFRLRTTSTFGQSRSNNNYEAAYRYNYHNANYQFGFTYDY